MVLLVEGKDGENDVEDQGGDVGLEVLVHVAWLQRGGRVAKRELDRSVGDEDAK
jgi:hypothetical protein